MALCPFAEQRTAGINNGGRRAHPIIGVTVHHMDGWWQGAESRFRDPSSDASAAFGIKLDGSIIQWLDTDLVDYHACQAQWEGWIGFENESDPATENAPPTVAQIASMGRLIAWLGVPAVPATSRTSGGVGYHRQFGGPCAQAWGQTACPGDGFVAAIPAICAAAGATPDPTPTPDLSVEEEDDSMYMRVWTTGTGGWWLTWRRPTDGRRVKRALTGTEADELKGDAVFGKMPNLFKDGTTPYVVSQARLDALPGGA